MAEYGYFPSGAPADWGATSTAGVSNQRAYKPDAMSGNGWGYAMKVYMGRRITGGTVTVELATYDSAENLFERTAAFSVGTIMEDIAGGAIYTQDLLNVIKVRDGKVYPLAVLGTGAPYGHGMIAASKISADDEKFYFKDKSSQPPADPMAWTTSATNGHIALVLLYEPNVAPDKPDSGLEPDINETGVSSQPFFEAFFRDDNEVVPGFAVGEADQMGQYQIQVGVGATGSSVLYDSQWVNATATEKTDRKFHHVYPGTLAPGVYRWRCRVNDQFGAASTYSDWIPFTVGGGTVSIPSPSPTGKQLTRTPGPYAFRWDHSGGLSTNAVAIRIVNSTGTVIRTSGTITKTVADAASGSITWAETGFSSLPIGFTGYYQVQARGTDNNWSDWSNPSATFSVDAAPAVPANLYPDRATVNTLPELRCYVTDPDDVAASLTVTAEVKNSAGTVLFTRTMTHMGNNWFKYQVVSGDGLVSGTDYRWTAYVTDGTFYSGGATTSGSASRAADANFTYVLAAVPTLDFPIGMQLINTTRPVYDWTFAGTQTKFRLVVWDPFNPVDETTGVLEYVYDSGIQTQSATYHTQPANYLKNDTRYRWQVTVWDNTNAATTSAPEDFDVEIDDVPVISFIEAGVHTVAGDDVGTAIKLSWGQTTYSSDLFQKYIINRRFDRETLIDIDNPYGTKVHRLAEIDDPAVTSFIDYLPPFGVTVYYSVRQEILFNGASYEGDSIGAEAFIDFDGVVICDARHAGDKRAVFRGRRQRRVKRNGNSNWVTPWNERAPTKFRTREFSRDYDTEYPIYSEDPLVIERTLLDLDRMTIDGGPLVYRDGRGKISFGDLDDGWVENDPEGGGLRSVSLNFRQTNARLVADF